MADENGKPEQPPVGGSHISTGSTTARFITAEQKAAAAAAGTPIQLTPAAVPVGAPTVQRTGGPPTMHTPTGPVVPQTSAPVGVPAAQQPVAAPPAQQPVAAPPAQVVEEPAAVVVEEVPAAQVVEQPAAVVEQPAATEPPAGVVFGAAAVEVARSLGVPYVFDRATGAPVDFDRAAEMIAAEPNSVCLDFNQLEPDDDDDDDDTAVIDPDDRAALEGEPTDREAIAFTRPAGPTVEVRITPQAVRVEVGGPVRVNTARAGETRIFNIQTEPKAATETETEPTE